MPQKEAYREHAPDFLKGLCSILVVLTHYAWQSAERRTLLFPWWVDMAALVFMMMSGYVYEKSCRRRNIECLSQAYAPGLLFRRAIRYTLPFVIVYCLMLLRDHLKYGAVTYDIFITFLQGGRGQGGFYYPVIMQFIFVVPVIRAIVRKYRVGGLLLCLAANLVFEVLHVAYNVPVESYRLLVLRYIFVIAAGCYLATGAPIKTLWGIVMSYLGILFLVMYLYNGYKPTYLIHWTGTSVAAGLYISPVIWLVMRKCKLRFAPLELLGKASYHTFLAQMLYYYSLAPVIYENVASRKLQLLISLVICLCSGILFYFIETPLTKLVQRKAEKLFD